MLHRAHRLLLAALLVAVTPLAATPALAHDAPGSTLHPVDFPEIVFIGEVATWINIDGPPAGEQVLHTTIDVNFTTPAEGTPAADVAIELRIPLESGTKTWVLHGTDFGWPATTGTFSATVDSDDYNGVLAGAIGTPAGLELALGVVTGGLYGQFLDSTITFELAGGTCQTDLGFAGPGAVSLSVCGDDLASGGTATLSLDGAPAFAPVFLAVGIANTPTPFKGGTLVPVPVLAVIPLAADGAGALSLLVPGGGGPFTLYVQAAVSDAAQPVGYALSNAVQVDLLP